MRFLTQSFAVVSLLCTGFCADVSASEHVEQPAVYDKNSRQIIELADATFPLSMNGKCDFKTYEEKVLPKVIGGLQDFFTDDK